MQRTIFLCLIFATSLLKGEESPIALVDEMYIIEGKSGRVTGQGQGYTKVPLPVVHQEGIEIISNFPKGPSLSPFEEPTYSNDEPSFSIDKRPVTNRNYKEFIQATGYAPPKHWQGKLIPTGLKDEPVVNVTYDDAVAYANWAGKRLPTYSEFQRALQKYPQLRKGAPLREWTSTSVPGTGEYYLIGGPGSTDAQKGSLSNQHTGFRLAR